MKMTDGSMTVQGPEVMRARASGSRAEIRRRSPLGFDRMAGQIKEQLGGDKPKLVFQFECSTRGKLMFREQEKLQLLKRFRQSVSPDVPWAGFYTKGGSWSGRRAQRPSSLDVGCPCPKLTMEGTIRV